MDKQKPLIVDEWEEQREEGVLGFRLIQGGPDEIWLEMRVQDEDGEWAEEWVEEDLDCPGADLLARLPTLIRDTETAERVRIRRELIEWASKGGELTPSALAVAIHRIVPLGPDHDGISSASTTSSGSEKE